MMYETLNAALLPAALMRTAEARAMAEGISGWAMMRRAGQAVAREAMRRWPDRATPILVLCGPGNNGGDGFVAAEALRREGFPVRAACLAPPESLKGDAAQAAKSFQGQTVPLSHDLVTPGARVIDALFGTGFARPLEGVALEIVRRMNSSSCPVIAVDMPSGIHGDTGEALGEAVRAEATVTFAARKPGHLLLPGKVHAGEIVVADIGIGAQVAAVLAEAEARGEPILSVNDPSLWRDAFPWPREESHKYMRGMAIVLGGGIASSGAARMAAMAAARLCGAVTVTCGREALPIYAAHFASVITRIAETPRDFAALAEDKKSCAVLLGPGGGVNAEMRESVLLALGTGKPVVLDADALAVFADEAPAIAGARRGDTVLTPHGGEFEALFGSRFAGMGKIARASAAARLTGATIVLKGADTVIARADGRRAVINSNAPPTLATAGSGDVLAGMIVGLLAGGMDGFSAACCAAWLHGEAARHLGFGLLAEELPGAIPAALQRLAGES